MPNLIIRLPEAEEANRLALDAECDELSLEVFEQNECTVRLHERHGSQIVRPAAGATGTARAVDNRIIASRDRGRTACGPSLDVCGKRYTPEMGADRSRAYLPLLVTD